MNLYPNTDLQTGKKNVFNNNSSNSTYYQNFVINVIKLDRFRIILLI